ncbi:MAG: phosphatidylglycerophosphatase A [Pelagibacterales bacterium]|nr:phosphatidylglycerophosphatase A [Pelagibacterales bacterium]
MIKYFNLLFLTLFKIGNVKYAPGTIASIFTCVIFIILNYFFSINVVLLLTIVVFLYSFVAINNSYESFNSEDPQEIVVDEFVGQMLPLIAIPVYETLFPAPVLYYCISSFLLFRFFDILKPFPISYIDTNVKGATGIMLDDVVAGFFSIIVLSIFFFFIGG